MVSPAGAGAGAGAAGNKNNGKSSSSSIAEHWRELQGLEDSWQRLLADPLHIDLRKSIISYGELVCATGYGFNREQRSPHYGMCLHAAGDLLAKSGVADAVAGNYTVTKLLYATAAPWLTPPKQTTWMGYVAVATDSAGVAALGRRDIVVVWRGTMTDAERSKDVEFNPVPADPVLGGRSFPSAIVYSGFLDVYTDTNADSEVGKTSAQQQVREEVRRLVELYKDEETSITVTGHSLGGSLSILTAVDLVSNGVNKASSSSSSAVPVPVTAVVFACPHVGNDAFKDAMDSFDDLRVLHVRNEIDPIPHGLPPGPALGVTMPIDTTLSPYIREPKINTAHELECYLHAVAGRVGDDGEFELVVERDVALLNRNNDVLTDEHPVPAIWWVAEHKGMVKNAKGKWELKDFEEY